jgi:hypothetical protein
MTIEIILLCQLGLAYHIIFQAVIIQLGFEFRPKLPADCSASSSPASGNDPETARRRLTVESRSCHLPPLDSSNHEFPADASVIELVWKAKRTICLHPLCLTGGGSLR